MRIDPNAKATNLPETESCSRTGAARVPVGEGLADDAATLSSGSRIQQLEKQVNHMPDGRADRIEALTRAVRAGAYEVDPSQIAQALFDEMSARSVRTF